MPKVARLPLLIAPFACKEKGEALEEVEIGVERGDRIEEKKKRKD